MTLRALRPALSTGWLLIIVFAMGPTRPAFAETAPRAFLMTVWPDRVQRL